MTINEGLALANAGLSTISVLCMIAAYRAIRAKRVKRHRNLMLAAFGASACFLVLFVERFVRYGFTKYEGDGPMRLAYLVVFFSHEPIAVVSVPLVVCAVVLGLRGSFASHKEVARMALPVWLYAAASGVLLYLMLYVHQR